MPLIAKFATQSDRVIGRCSLPNRFTETRLQLSIAPVESDKEFRRAAMASLQISAVSRWAFTSPTVALFTLSIQKRRQSVCVHSGRKGTELGVVPNAIRQMIDRFGSDPAKMIVQLSPCIRPPHYESRFRGRNCPAMSRARRARNLRLRRLHGLRSGSLLFLSRRKRKNRSHAGVARVESEIVGQPLRLPVVHVAGGAPALQLFHARRCV